MNYRDIKLKRDKYINIVTSDRDPETFYSMANNGGSQ